MRLDVAREAQILARLDPADAEELREHLREMRSDRWAREVITQSVEVSTSVAARLEALEKSVDTSTTAIVAKIDAIVAQVAPLLEAEARRVAAEAHMLEASGDRARSIGQAARDIATAPPALVVYGVIAAWLAQRLGVAIDAGQVIP